MPACNLSLLRVGYFFGLDEVTVYLLLWSIVWTGHFMTFIVFIPHNKQYCSLVKVCKDIGMHLMPCNP